MLMTTATSPRVEDVRHRDRLRLSDPGVETLYRARTIEHSSADKRLLRILVVDDNRDAADSLSILVRLWGYDVRRAYGGAAALELVAAQLPDVLLLDLGMPEVDGCQVARQLRRETRANGVLLVAVTGFADKAHRLLGARAGFDHYLIKPLELDVLEKLLRLQKELRMQSLAVPLALPAWRLRLAREEDGVRGFLNLGLR